MTTEKNTHYVCAGTCGGVSDHAQNCEDKSCMFFDQPLHRCDCTDGTHRANAPTGSMPAPALN
ncbi:MAG: hypothetical protein AAB410_00585 [Patescibacteria group bacterium]